MSSEPLRIGVLGLTHDHVWGNLQALAECGAAEIAAAADPHEPLRRRLREEFGGEVYEDASRLLDAERLDAVYVFSDNDAGARLAEAAAARGLHALVEKPMAATLAGADRMLAAARRAGTRLMINWPFAWWPQMQQAVKLAKGGSIGEVWQVKYRAAHAGPKELGCSDYFCDWLYDAERNGGGAMMDYCCYGALLARVILGPPARVWGHRGRLVKESILVEDNGLIVMTYPRATALAEGSWTQIGDISSYVTHIFGTRGTLLVEPRGDGRLLLADEENPAGRPLDIPAPAAGDRNSAVHFIQAVTGGGPLMPLVDPRCSRDAQEILEAGARSAASGREVSFPLR